MPLIIVTSQTPGAGKTGVAAAIARHYAYLGRPVTLTRVAADAGNANEDAALFATFDFAPGSAATPVAASSVTALSNDAVLVVEADATAAAAITGATAVVLVARHGEPLTVAGLSPAALVVTDVPASATVAAPAGIPCVTLGEDRTLAGFAVSEIQAAINADVLVPGDNGDTTCDHLVVSPISSDAGQPYFRRFPTKAVVVRFDRTDQHLAAMRGEPQCLILTGGRTPSDYLVDAASATGTPVLLAQTDTENTVIALEGLFDKTRFQGQRKLERMSELLESSEIFSAIGL